MHVRWKRTISMLLALVTVLCLIPMGQAEAASMAKGSSGSQVSALQKNLIGLGYLDGTADGVYGSMTATAVRNFQWGYGLSADGVAGDVTQTAVRNAVVRLQVELQANGYSVGGVDGKFGSMTASALKAFQRDHGLKQSGEADKNTWKLLNENSASLNVTSTLRRGSSGRQVTILQKSLAGLGYLTGAVDGIYGAQTVAALKLYQSDYGLTADGVAGPKTLFSVNATIVALQTDLNRAGYSCGKADGIYGDGVRAAVKRYQSAWGLPVTGVAGAQTINKLYGRNLGSTNTGTGFGNDGVYKTWIDSLYQNGDESLIWYANGTRTTTVHKSGCGGVALAMALNALQNTNRHTGQNVMQWFADNGYYWGEGTKHDGIWDYPRRLGLGTAYCGSAQTLVEHLKQNRLAVALIWDRTGEALLTYAGGSGHYILISGYRMVNGVQQVFVNNPLSYKSSMWYELDQVMANVYDASDGYPNPFIVVYK